MYSCTYIYTVLDKTMEIFSKIHLVFLIGQKFKNLLRKLSKYLCGLLIRTVY